ncbi:MAG: sulfite oxidase [Ectothiorhodospiraceae bacterium]|jgi:DMSO/TMAO reductase YedYZ molybdopterin-dependent catalytic subunit
MYDPDECDTGGITRREFAKLVGLTGLTLCAAPSLIRDALANETPDSSIIIPGKASDMIVHNAKLGVMETPLTMLREHYITPKEIMYQRMHFPVSGANAWVDSTDAPDFKDWNIEVSGLVSHPAKISLAELQKMKHHKVTAVMQCAGNGRAFYAAKSKCPGGQWHHGGMANVEWEGPSLREVLDSLNLSPGADATWLSANGRDVPPTDKGADFIKSFHLADPALDHALLAVKMNGEPIPAIHGAPVRLVIPGFYGNMNVKSVDQLLLTARESPSPFQSMAYRVPHKLVQPGQMQVSDFNDQNSAPTYAFKIMSVIFSPLAEDGTQKAGNNTVKGVAFNDGTAPITQVEVSVDGGKSWQAASIKEPPSAFAWYQWEADVSLKAGENELMARATDAAGRTQPMDGTELWNPKGYQWHGVDRVKVKAS